MIAPPSRAGHQIQLLHGGNAFFPALVGAIDASRSEVRLETYIFHLDQSGTQVASALVRAAQRGVLVYLLMDGVGTPSIPQEWAQRLSDAGVKWHRFLPLGTWGLFIPGRWRRLHRKLCVIDAAIGFCGGINMVDDLFDPDHGVLESPRFDFAVRVTGPLVADAHRAMVQFWNRLQFTHQLEHLQFKEVRQTWTRIGFLPERKDAVVHPADISVGGGVDAMLLLRDNLHNRTRIERAYRKAIADARHEVLIANAYFLPGGKLRRSLMHAAQRGVRVTLLLQGRYENFMQFHASRPVFGALLEAGVEIYEYSAGFLHAKVAVVDGHWATVGSSNLDPLSLLLAREANVVVQDAAFAQELRASLVMAMQTQGARLEPHVYADRPWRQRILDQLAFGAMRLVLFLTGKRY